ncbi:MAG: GxxExxY protein [Puniceicoccaceae bacterium]|jgi:GxxExxY protein|nr:GxxExxY protein [Puniceicoccaceae bacterium]MBL6913219.1 GxxExxY protein [Puniceicoccaceae bacterium]
MSLEREDITKEIIGAAFEVHNALGYGFLEKVYQNAMIVELKLRGIDATAEKLIQVYFKNHIVGDYRADLTVDDVIVELKVTAQYNSKDEPQLLNELAATKSPVGLLINFGREKVEFKRFISSTK